MKQRCRVPGLSSPSPPGSEADLHKATGTHWFHQQVQKKNSARRLVGPAPQSPPRMERGAQEAGGGSPGTDPPPGRRAAGRPEEGPRAACAPGRSQTRSLASPASLPSNRAPAAPRVRPRRLGRLRVARDWSPRGREVPVYVWAKAGALASGHPPGAGDPGAAPGPAPPRRPRPRTPGGAACRTHRAWPPCRPRRAGSPRGRAPPAGRCSPPRPPAARAAAALCSEPWARARRAPATSTRLPGRPRRGPGAGSSRPPSSAASAGPPPLRPRAPPRAGEGARPPPRLPRLRRGAALPPAARRRAAPGLAPGLIAAPAEGRSSRRRAAAGEEDSTHSSARRRLQAAGRPSAPETFLDARGLIWAARACPALRGWKPQGPALRRPPPNPPSTPQSLPGRCASPSRPRPRPWASHVCASVALRVKRD